MRKKRGSKVREILGSPWFRVVEVVLVLAGIIIPSLLYFSSRAERELVYAVNPVRTTVVTAGQASELAVFHEGEPLGNVDVTAAQVAIWNAGKQSIREENILEDVVICTDPPVLILEASIRQCSREVTEFTLIETPELLASGRVPVSWNILEKNDGASVQLIYVGAQEVDFHVEGVIEGLRGIRDVELGVKIKTPQEQIRAQQSSRTIYGIMAIIFGVLVIFAIVGAFLKPRRWRDLFDVAFALGILGLSIWGYFSISTHLWPPFGF
jgi:4-amino-4-deoxy-L-arabinose transferase-like glycosyltransferase